MLITKVEISTLARPVYTDDAKIEQFIKEAEQIDIRKALGDKFYNYIVEHHATETEVMTGGSYEFRGDTYNFAGLKTALAYYVYSRLVLGSNIEMTRSGVVNRTSEYSQRSDWQERQAVSRETASIADKHVNDLLGYLRNDDRLSALVSKRGEANSSRTKIKIIGK